jgi:hypothetical protein
MCFDGYKDSGQAAALLNEYMTAMVVKPIVNHFSLFGRSIQDMERETDRLGFVGLRSSLKKEERQLSEAVYKDEHCEIYRLAGLVWPPPESERYQSFAYFGTRAVEATQLYDRGWPRQADIEFCDLNPTSSRYIAWNSSCVFEDLRSPWKTTIMTITAQAKIAVRYCCGGTEVVRPLEGWEALQLIGWQTDMWTPGRQRPPYDLAVSLAGNAFSACAIGPVFLASFGAIGMKFKEPATIDLNAGSDSESLDSFSE